MLRNYGNGREGKKVDEELWVKEEKEEKDKDDILRNCKLRRKSKKKKTIRLDYMLRYYGSRSRRKKKIKMIW